MFFAAIASPLERYGLAFRKAQPAVGANRHAFDGTVFVRPWVFCGTLRPEKVPERDTDNRNQEEKFGHGGSLVFGGGAPANAGRPS